MNKHQPNPHSKFFSSLKHLQKRLKLDINTNPSTSSHPSQSPLTSPLFLHQPNNPSTTTQLSQSEPPLEFLSNPTSFPPTPPTQNVTQPHHIDGDGDVDEIGLLIDLLGLSISDDGMDISECSCRCDGGFYDKIVGVKGPKCMKEVERLDGWIRWLRKERVESFRLAHLLLGKASLGGVEFPSTVDGFLRLDPPFAEDV